MKRVSDVNVDELWACASQEALQRTVDIARRALKAPASVVTSFVADRQVIRCVSDVAQISSTLALSGLLCREVVETGRPLILADDSADCGRLEIMRDIPIRAYLGVPVRLSRGRIIGALCVLDTQTHAWTNADLELVTELSAFLTSQIELKLESLQREKAEEALSATRARLLTVADRIPGLVFERRKIDGDRCSYTFFGSTKSDLPGIRQLMEDGSTARLNFIHREDRDRVRAAMLRSNLEETDLDLTFRVKDVGHSVRWLRSQSIVRRDSDGTVCWDGLCFDISDLVAAREDAESARSAKHTLLVNVNHELRAPLQTIIGFTDFLKMETRPDLVAAHARNIQSAAKSLLAIVNQLLEDAGGEHMSIALVTVDLCTFGETCLSMVAPRALEKKVSLQLEIDADVPATVLIDAQKLQQALVNLLNNAVKFTDEGGITVRVGRAAKGLRFNVIDTGIGIPEEKRDLLFQRFSRLVPDDSPTEGSGLGLSITKALVESMDGAIGVERHVGRGTTFWFDVPLRGEPGKLETLDKAPQPPSFAETPLGSAAGARILLADDLDLNRKLIADMLSLDGHVVDCVSNGAEAVAAASQRPYDLILMDMIMPGMDGIAATRAIRAMSAPTCDVPIVALTANSFFEQLDGCLKAGMDATLVKPMSIEALSSAVSTWTRGRKAA
jgi:signal transduction histidine kinase/ActR/RegA family two-component response regulator